MRPIELLVVMMIIAVLGALLLHGGDNDRTHRFPPQETRPSGDFSSVAGEYYQGLPRGRYLSLSILADGRYSFVWSGCTGVHHREGGYVRESNGSFVLSPVTGDQPKIDRQVVLVRWNSRRYLVPPDKMHSFCDEVATGDEPRNEHPGHFWLRLPFAAEHGVPELPTPWAGYLDDHLLIGKITETKDAGFATAEFGPSAVIKQGTILHVRAGDSHSQPRLFVVSVHGGLCLARDIYSNRLDPSVKLGQEVVAARVTDAIAAQQP